MKKLPQRKFKQRKLEWRKLNVQKIQVMGLHPKKLKIILFRKIKETMVFQGLQVPSRNI